MLPLIKRLALIERIPPRKAKTLLLSCMLVGDGAISATSLDMQARVDAQELNFEPVAVNARALMKALRALGPDAVLSRHKEMLVVESTKGRVAIGGDADAADWPTTKGFSEKPWEVERPEAIGSLVPFMSREEARYYLNGIGFKDGRATATDGHRLRWVPCKHGGDAILPDIAAKIVARMAESLLEMTPMAFRAEMPGLTLSGKNVDGTFPDTDRIRLQAPKLLAKVKATALTEAIKTVAWVAQERSAPVRLTIDKARILVEARQSMFDMEGAASCEADVVEPATSGFNSHYLLSILDQTSGRVELWRDDEFGPMQIKDGSDAANYLMPMRI